jgi:hypothetical protein
MRGTNNVILKDDLFDLRLEEICSRYPQRIDGHCSMSGPHLVGVGVAVSPTVMRPLFDGCLSGCLSEGKAAPVRWVPERLFTRG